MRPLYLVIITFFAFFFFINQSVAQRTATDTVLPKEQLDAYEKPIREFVGWMKTNLQLSEDQEKELLEFYLTTPIYFASASAEANERKEESLKLQEATLKKVLTPQQLEILMSRKDEAYQVLLQNVPKK